MKKLSLFLLITMLVSCTCLPQIPPQVVFTDDNCQAELPDYRDWVRATDNCTDVIISQSPQAGTILDSGTPWIKVTLTATDGSDNIDTRRFDVLLVDTIPPVLIIDSTKITYTWEQRNTLIRAYHESIGAIIYKSPYRWADSIFANNNMIIITAPGSQHFAIFDEPIDY